MVILFALTLESITFHYGNTVCSQTSRFEFVIFLTSIFCYIAHLAAPLSPLSPLFTIGTNISFPCFRGKNHHRARGMFPPTGVSTVDRYWGLWAVQQLHGVHSLLATLRTNCDTALNEKVVKSTLRSLSRLVRKN